MTTLSNKTLTGALAVSLLALAGCLSYAFVNDDVRNAILKKGDQNISAGDEDLNAFRVMDNDLRVQQKLLDKRNFALMESFESFYINDPVRVEALMRDAKMAMELCAQFSAMTNALRNHIVEKAKGDDMHLAASNMMDTRIVTTIMINKDMGANLRKEIERLKMSLLDLPTLDANDKTTLAEYFGFTMDTGNPDDGDEKGWEKRLFENMPLVAADNVLAKLENEARFVTGLFIETLLRKINAYCYFFDDLQAQVRSAKSYISPGEEFKAEIFIAAQSATQHPKVYIGSFDPYVVKYTVKEPLPTKLDKFPMAPGYDSLRVIGGVGRYSYKTTKQADVGLRYETGVLKVKKPIGEGFDYFPFRIEFEVRKP